MENEVPDFFNERDVLGLEKPYNKFDDKLQFTDDESIELDVEYASFISRSIAYILDCFFILIATLIIQMLIIGSDSIIPDNLWTRNLLSFFIWTVYYGLTESSKKQATFGKQICGIKVIDKNGNKLNLEKAVLRFWAKLLSWLPFGFGIWAITVDKKKQAWHDAIVGCYVIKAGTQDKPNEEEISEPDIP